jgi:hypothetical protein
MKYYLLVPYQQTLLAMLSFVVGRSKLRSICQCFSAILLFYLAIILPVQGRGEDTKDKVSAAIVAQSTVCCSAPSNSVDIGYIQTHVTNMLAVLEQLIEARCLVMIGELRLFSVSESNIHLRPATLANRWKLTPAMLRREVHNFFNFTDGAPDFGALAIYREELLSTRDNAIGCLRHSGGGNPSNFLNITANMSADERQLYIIVVAYFKSILYNEFSLALQRISSETINTRVIQILQEEGIDMQDR